MLIPRNSSEWVRLLFIVALVWGVGVGLAPSWLITDVFAQSVVTPKKTKKKRTKKKRKKRTSTSKKKKKVEPPPPPEPPPPEPEPDSEPSDEERRLEEERARVEAAQAKRKAEGRKTSQLAAGTPSRWSNRGAMVPVVAEVPITAPLPDRNVPRAAGVETPGQKLFEGDEVLSARLSLSGMRLVTAGQNLVYAAGDLVRDKDRNIELIRGRANMAYTHIGGSEFGAHVDLEYRPSLNFTRFTDQRINELYVSYGLTDFRGSKTNLSYGFALGRLSIREAGYAQADGLAFRLKVVDEVNVGVFGGVTGNPYGYNWDLRTSQFVSADWFTGGLFSSINFGAFNANVAGVVTYANVAPDASGLDRIYVALDASYLFSSEFNVFVAGNIDLLPTGQLIQNLELSGTYTPNRELSLSASVGRFSTVLYDKTTAYSYTVDDLGNKYAANGDPIVGENGNPIIPFDAAIYSTVYNSLRARAGYRIIRPVEVYATVSALLRDFSATEAALAEDALIEEQLNAVPFRMLPAAGVRYRDPKLIDANLQATVVLDERSNTKAILSAGVGREIYGLYGGIDGRYYFGDIAGIDGGVNIAYTFPRDWFPGLMLVRATARYFQERLSLLQPVDDDRDNQVLIPSQNSLLLFAAVEWRL